MFREVEGEVRRRNVEKGIGASEFEVLTATAFGCFSRERVRVGVVECGMGGARDATNVLGAEGEVVCCCVVTRIGVDHEAVLGVRGVEGIAGEKAGIFKAGVPVVADWRNGEGVVGEVLRRKAREVGAEDVVWAGADEWEDEWGVMREVEVRGWPVHQRDNLAVALRAFEVARGRLREREGDGGWDGATPSRSAIWSCLPGLGVEAPYPGRLQEISIKAITGRTMPVLLDGAHNVQSAQVLGQYVDERLRSEGAPVTWVVAISKGKEVEEILSQWLRPGDNVVATAFGRVDGMPWVEAERPEKIVEAVSQMRREQSSGAGASSTGHAEAAEQSWTAIQRGSDLAGQSGRLVIAGSLYLVSDVLRMLRNPPISLAENDVSEWSELQSLRLDRRRGGEFDRSQ